MSESLAPHLVPTWLASASCARPLSNPCAWDLPEIVAGPLVKATNQMIEYAATVCDSCPVVRECARRAVVLQEYMPWEHTALAGLPVIGSTKGSSRSRGRYAACIEALHMVAGGASTEYARRWLSTTVAEGAGVGGW